MSSSKKKNFTELSTLGINATLRGQLAKAGYVYIEDIIHMKAHELSRELKIPADEAFSILRSAEDAMKPAWSLTSVQTAWSLLEKESSNIVSFSSRLDGLLDGGVPVGKITEFCGAANVGKTQLCIQLAVDVQISEQLGGLEGEAIYIDTEGSFMAHRAAEIAQATVDHCNNLDPFNKEFNVESILSRIHYFRCFDHIQLIATLHTLETFINTNKNIRLIIVDSIAQPFRHEIEDYTVRTKILSSLSQTFSRLAQEYKLAVVLTNQMTTRFENGRAMMVPSLGDSWGHACSCRVILHWLHNKRHALLYKSPSKQEATVSYQITKSGIRDIF